MFSKYVNDTMRLAVLVPCLLVFILIFVFSFINTKLTNYNLQMNAWSCINLKNNLIFAETRVLRVLM